LTAACPLLLPPYPRRKPPAILCFSRLYSTARKLRFRLHPLSSDQRSAASQTADRRSEAAKARASDLWSARTFGSPLPVGCQPFPNEVHWISPLVSLGYAERFLLFPPFPSFRVAMVVFLFVHFVFFVVKVKPLFLSKPLTNSHDFNYTVASTV
jgi:hypothetical protein